MGSDPLFFRAVQAVRIRGAVLALVACAGLSSTYGVELPVTGGTLAADARAFRLVRDVPYLDSEAPERLDLYLPARLTGERRSPAVIWMHGNHHGKGDAREHNVCETLATAGYVCASIDYGSWTESDQDPATPAQNRHNLANAKTAVRFLRLHAADFHLDPERIAAWGASAGGYLAVMMGFTNADGSFSAAGPYPGEPSTVAAVGDFYGDYEPIVLRQLRADFPPTLIVHGQSDPAEDYHLSSALAQALSAVGVPHEYVLLPAVGHGFDLTTWNHRPLPRDLRPIVLEFLRDHLGPPSEPAPAP